MVLAGIAQNAAELRPHLERAFKQRTLAEWKAFLDSQPDVIYDAICDYGDVLADPQAAANDYIVEIDVPSAGPRKLVGNLIQLSETPGSAKPLLAEMGQHTEEILLELGYSWDEITEINTRTREALREKFAAFGLEPPQ